MLSHVQVSTARRFARATFPVALLAAALLARPPAAQASASAPLAVVRDGTLQGTTVGNMDAFVGIPYAAPPVGALRWLPPQPPKTWYGRRPALKFAPHCPQLASPFGEASRSEDCLYLNVFAPHGTKAGAKLPVMVWIHGGAFVSGESNDYDPDRLVAQHAVVVTLNYRLGYLGFLATTGLDNEGHAHVNYGLLDQQAALAWVRANIASFGGNPANATVFGESAGGLSTILQVLSPAAAGLFSQALVESGAYAVLTLPSLQAAETAGNAVAKTAGCSPDDTACLRKLTVEQVLALQPVESLESLTSGPGPAVDGTVVPEAPESALLSGSFTHVPIVDGTNKDEFRLFTAELFDLRSGPITKQEYPVLVTAVLEAAGLQGDANEVLAQYPLSNYKSPDLAFSAFATDAAFCATTYITNSLLGVQTPTYAYEFADEKAPEDFLPPVSFPYAAAHASELQFIWDSFTRKGKPLSSIEHQLAGNMVGQWTTFAATGLPDSFTLPLWLPFVPEGNDLEQLVPPTPGMYYNFVGEHKVDFWQQLLLGSATSPRAGGARHYITVEHILRALATVRGPQR
jgi:para-nitrobenzyl esterase